MTKQISVFPTADELAAAAAELWIELAKQAAQQNRDFHVALSGGSTPKRLFQLMARDSYANRMPWEKVHVYFGDERFVPHDHPDSNFLMATENLLALVPIPSDNIHSINTAVTNAEQAARDYETQLKQYLPNINKQHQFDLVFLGLGADGHTASLFPGTKALEQKTRLVDAVYVSKLDSWRITLTYPVINHAGHCVFLVEGSAKADIVAEILGDKNNSYPAAKVNPEGQLHWMLDQQAAAKLEK